MKVCNVSALGLCLTMWSSSQVSHVKILVKDSNVILALLNALVCIGFETAKTKHIYNHEVDTQNCFGNNQGDNKEIISFLYQVCCVLTASEFKFYAL